MLKHNFFTLVKLVGLLMMLHLILNLFVPSLDVIPRTSEDNQEYNAKDTSFNLQAVHRKLSFVPPNKHQNNEHMQPQNLSDYSFKEDFHCLNTNTTPSFHICVHDIARDKYISGSLRSSGIWEPYITILFQAALGNFPSAHVIDIGANIGYYTLLASAMGHQVIAIEPSIENVERCRKGIQINKMAGRVTLLCNALWDHVTNVTLTTNNENQGGLRVLNVPESEQTLRPRVKTITLNNLLNVAKMKQAIIKIDIEGSECKAMKNAEHLLKKVYVPYIFMEWKKMFVNRNNPKSTCPAVDMLYLTETLWNKGYIPYEVRTGFQLSPDRCATKWRIGDIYWRHEHAQVLQEPF